MVFVMFSFHMLKQLCILAAFVFYTVCVSRWVVAVQKLRKGQLARGINVNQWTTTFFMPYLDSVFFVLCPKHFLQLS